MRQHEQHFTKYLTRTLQTCQGHERQGKTEELLQIGRDRGDVTIKGSVRSGTEKEHSI